MSKYTEITNIRDKTSGDNYEVITKGKIRFFVKLDHKLLVLKLKKHLRFMKKIKVNKEGAV